VSDIAGKLLIQAELERRETPEQFLSRLCSTHAGLYPDRHLICLSIESHSMILAGTTDDSEWISMHLRGLLKQLSQGLIHPGLGGKIPEAV
jgi:hypothetical protein